MRRTLLLVFLACLTVYFSFPLFGTSDMSAWVRSASVNLEYGPVKAYKEYNMYYPPLSSFIIWTTAKISQFEYEPGWLDDYPKPEVVGSAYLPIKSSILIFLLFSVLLIQTTIANKLIIFLNPALIWVTLVLGYIDIYIVPTLILAFYFYRQKKYFLSGVALATTFLIKLIPIFLLPVFLLSFIQLNIMPFKLKIRFSDGLYFSLGILLTTTLVFLIYDPRDFLDIITMSAGHGKYLSMNAMNVHWLIRQIFVPINLAPIWIANISKLLFMLIAGVSLLDLMVTKEKVIGILRASLTLLFSYAMMFTGAHENHLFPAFMISLILYYSYPTQLSKLWYRGISMILFLNLLLFYRLGQGVSINFVNLIFANTTLNLILINSATFIAVTFYLYYLYTNYSVFYKKIWQK